MPTRRTLLGLAICLTVTAPIAGCRDGSDSPSPGTSLERGEGSFTITLPGVTKGNVVYFSGSAITNLDTSPIRILDVAPERTDSGLKFSRALTQVVDRSTVTVASWSGSPSDEQFLLAQHDWNPIVGTTLKPGATDAGIELRFEVEKDPTPPLTAEGLRVTYEKNGKQYVEVLKQRLVVSREAPTGNP